MVAGPIKKYVNNNITYEWIKQLSQKTEMNILLNKNRLELYIFLLETQVNDANKLKVKGWKNLHQAKQNQEAGMITVIYD